MALKRSNYYFKIILRKWSNKTGHGQVTNLEGPKFSNLFPKTHVKKKNNVSVELNYVIFMVFLTSTTRLNRKVEIATFR